MKRYHRELLRTSRVHQLHLRCVHGWPAKPVKCVCDLQAGRFRKRKALGCRRPRCLLCHYEKIFGILSVKDRIRVGRYLDSLADYQQRSDESS